MTAAAENGEWRRQLRMEAAAEKSRSATVLDLQHGPIIIYTRLPALFILDIRSARSPRAESV